MRDARALQLQLAASKSGAVAADQKRSHGIGGAGNISRFWFLVFEFLFYCTTEWCATSNLLLFWILSIIYIGRPSEVIYPVKLNADGTKKRGIAWSTKTTAPGLNQNGKRPALLGMFGKKGNSGSKTTTTARMVEQHPTTDQREGAGKKEDRNI